LRVNPEHHDKTFVLTFLAVLGFLGAFTVGIIVISNFVAASEPDDKGELARIAQRIKPAGEVVTDPAALLALAAADKPAARAPMSGEEVVTKLCGACHTAGTLGAPKIGDKGEWAKRKAGGINALVASAIKGKNAMPPKGGDPSLSDDEVKAAVQDMLKKSGA
jgi:cytochrome c5